MTKKELTKILKRRYSESMVKKVRAGIVKPSGKKRDEFFGDGIPYEAWSNIRQWLEEQQKLKGE
ncbi:hypothetical protein [Campylobacter sp. RM16191]|uniref:hypothetical protein n=1 Tax=Campylobacter sp. RM16191 TaxID=1705728 RepID=UPI001472FCA7|nr:hypothetical protein [Campylobacter sp. RM16191]